MREILDSSQDDGLLKDSASSIEPVRPVTDDEVAFFHENGWVLLPGLVAAELCGAMLERGRPELAGMMAADGSGFANFEEQRKALSVSAASGKGTVADIKQWVEWRGPVRSVNDPVFARAALAPAMGDNVRRLLNRTAPVRILHDILTCKLPDSVSTPTGWHQDSVSFPIDRNVLTVWIALDEIRPEQGPVQFFSGSQKRGMLGRLLPAGRADLLRYAPELTGHPLSPPHHLRPGDVTVHHGLVVHGAGANRGADPRWSYLICYFPGDARYSGAPNHDFDGFGLKLGEPVDHPSFSLIP